MVFLALLCCLCFSISHILQFGWMLLLLFISLRLISLHFSSFHYGLDMYSQAKLKPYEIEAYVYSMYARCICLRVKNLWTDLLTSIKLVFSNVCEAILMYVVPSEIYFIVFLSSTVYIRVTKQCEWQYLYLISTLLGNFGEWTKYSQSHLYLWPVLEYFPVHLKLETNGRGREKDNEN